jgi:hypothetical protein
MYILKTEEDEKDFIFYWTLDGEHIFRIQRTPKTKKGDTIPCGSRSCKI